MTQQAPLLRTRPALSKKSPAVCSVPACGPLMATPACSDSPMSSSTNKSSAEPDVLSVMKPEKYPGPKFRINDRLWCFAPCKPKEKDYIHSTAVFRRHQASFSIYCKNSDYDPLHLPGLAEVFSKQKLCTQKAIISLASFLPCSMSSGMLSAL